MKPKLLDLFCGAGGAAMGYHRAGFAVYGIDNKPQPHYPFPFLQMDAMEAMDILLRGEGLTFSNGETLYLSDFVAFHASPPCQFATRLTPPERRHLHKNLIRPMRNRLETTGKPFVIENVPDARKYLVNPLMLCGTMFGLHTHRHRYFEIYPDYYPLLPKCARIYKPVVVSGATRRKTGRFEYNAYQVKEVMGIDWMIRTEIDEAIPPAYTEYIGKYLMEFLNSEK